MGEQGMIGGIELSSPLMPCWAGIYVCQKDPEERGREEDRTGADQSEIAGDFVNTRMIAQQV